jgi:hypothetical protein
MFAAPSGKAGFALSEVGVICNFFVSPLETAGVNAELMGLAIDQGANRLCCYDHPVLPRYFARFGFQEAARVAFTGMDPRPDWPAELGTPEDARPDVLFMYLAVPHDRAAANAASLWEPLRRKGTACAVGQGICAYCGLDAKGHTTNNGVVAGYECPRCAFTDVWGLLALEPRPGK